MLFLGADLQRAGVLAAPVLIKLRTILGEVLFKLGAHKMYLRG